MMEAFVNDMYEINDKENMFFFPSMNGEEQSFIYSELPGHAHGHSISPYSHPLSPLNNQCMLRSMQEIDNIIDYGLENPIHHYAMSINPNGYKKIEPSETILEYNQKQILNSLEKQENYFFNSSLSESGDTVSLSEKKLNIFTACDNKQISPREKQINPINDFDVFNGTTNINNLDDNFILTWEDTHNAMLSSQILSNVYDQSKEQISDNLSSIGTNSNCYNQSQHQIPETLPVINTNVNDNAFISTCFPDLRKNTEYTFDSNMILKPSDFQVTSKHVEGNFCDLLNNHYDLQNAWKPLFIEPNTICPASLSSSVYSYQYSKNNNSNDSLQAQNCSWKATSDNIISAMPTSISTPIPLALQNINQDGSILSSFIRSYNTLKTQYSMKQVHSMLTIHRVIFKLNHYAQGLDWKHFLTACLQPLSNYTPPIALPWKPAYIHCLKGYEECWNWEWAPKSRNSKSVEEKNNEKKKLLFLPPNLPFGSKDVPLFLNSKKRINPSMLTKALENCPPEFKELITYKEEDFVMQCPAIYLRLSTEMKAPNLASQLKNKGLKPVPLDDRFYYRSSLFDPIVPLDHYTISSKLLVHSDPNERPYQNTKFEFIDRYNPEYYRYKGSKKQAHCSLCPPDSYDSEEDKKNDICSPGNWYVTKCSAFWYHKRYKHGIRKYGYPYPYPKNIEVIKDKSIQAQCPMCHKWMKAGMVDDIVPRAFWTHYDQCWNMVEAILSPKKKKKEDYCESNQTYKAISKQISHLSDYEKQITKGKFDPKIYGKEKDEDNEIEESLALPTLLPPLELDDGDEYFPEEDEFSFVILKKNGLIAHVVESHTKTAIQSNGGCLGTLITLDLRGERFVLDREELISLPESILLCLFPNGWVMNEGSENDPIVVDYDSSILSYVIQFFCDSVSSPRMEKDVLDKQNIPFPGKVAIIVLKEDLDFYVIASPNETTGDTSGDTSADTISKQHTLKRAVGKRLVDINGVFDGLWKSRGFESNNGDIDTSEQYLIDMLCSSGFKKDDKWPRRVLEPSRACISSLALTEVKNNDKPSTSSINTSQKLLLFWRKPARKCWWDCMEFTNIEENIGKVKVWARRVWTLELSILSMK
ncbi:hypothetical protein PCK1_002521 [Pneumocystis canis]|nr:hypothetical protein PCK1_002521 [Pneumocystis canis]